jgi:hypothetical protein
MSVSKIYIQQQIRQRGKASVMVMLSSETKTDQYLAALDECFEHSEQHRAVAAVGATGGRGHIYRKHEHPASLYLENLGVVYGQVNKKGWEMLQGRLAASDDVAGMAPMQAIRGLGSDAAPPTTPQVAWGVARRFKRPRFGSKV